MTTERFNSIVTDVLIFLMAFVFLGGAGYGVFNICSNVYSSFKEHHRRSHLIGQSTKPILGLHEIYLNAELDDVLITFQNDSIKYLRDNSVAIRHLLNLYGITFDSIHLEGDSKGKINEISLVFHGTKQEVRTAMNTVQLQLFSQYGDTSRRLVYKNHYNELFYLPDPDDYSHAIVLTVETLKDKKMLCLTLNEQWHQAIFLSDDGYERPERY